MKDNKSRTDGAREGGGSNTPLRGWHPTPRQMKDNTQWDRGRGPVRPAPDACTGHGLRRAKRLTRGRQEQARLGAASSLTSDRWDHFGRRGQSVTELPLGENLNISTISTHNNCVFLFFDRHNKQTSKHLYY